MANSSDVYTRLDSTDIDHRLFGRLQVSTISWVAGRIEPDLHTWTSSITAAGVLGVRARLARR